MRKLIGSFFGIAKIEPHLEINHSIRVRELVPKGLPSVEKILVYEPARCKSEALFLLIPGSMVFSSNLRINGFAFYQELARCIAEQGLRVVQFDLAMPSDLHGFSISANYALLIESLCGVLTVFSDRPEGRSRIVLLGHSLGGRAALELKKEQGLDRSHLVVALCSPVGSLNEHLLHQYACSMEAYGRNRFHVAKSVRFLKEVMNGCYYMLTNEQRDAYLRGLISEHGVASHFPLEHVRKFLEDSEVEEEFMNSSLHETCACSVKESNFVFTSMDPQVDSFGELGRLSTTPKSSVSLIDGAGHFFEKCLSYKEIMYGSVSPLSNKDVFELIARWGVCES